MAGALRMSRVDAIEIAPAPVEIRLGLSACVPRGREVTELGHALEQGRSLPDGGEIVVEVGRHLGKVRKGQEIAELGCPLSRSDFAAGLSE